MKRLIGLLVGIVLVVGMAGLASAETSDSITLKVKCVTTLSVSISTGIYNFGSVAFHTPTISTETITVSNDSGSLIEDYTINCDTHTEVWNLQMIDPVADDEDVFSLKAMFKSGQATEGDFGDKAWLNTNAEDQQNMTLALFGSETDYSGDSVTPDANGNRKIWFRLYTPGYSSSTEEQSLSVTITANPGTTF